MYTTNTYSCPSLSSWRESGLTCGVGWFRLNSSQPLHDPASEYIRTIDSALCFYIPPRPVTIPPKPLLPLVVGWCSSNFKSPVLQGVVQNSAGCEHEVLWLQCQGHLTTSSTPQDPPSRSSPRPPSGCLALTRICFSNALLGVFCQEV